MPSLIQHARFLKASCDKTPTKCSKGEVLVPNSHLVIQSSARARNRHNGCVHNRGTSPWQNYTNLQVKYLQTYNALFTLTEKVRKYGVRVGLRECHLVDVLIPTAGVYIRIAIYAEATQVSDQNHDANAAGIEVLRWEYCYICYFVPRHCRQRSPLRWITLQS
jgi:hypothetical protein